MTLNWPLSRKRESLAARAHIISEIRSFFSEGGYLEVETPLRIPAPAPESHIDAIPSLDWYLQTSPEICMKRMLAAGYERLFQISHCWREGERGTLHVPEFTMLEWYRSDSDYLDLMNECESLLRSVAEATGLGYKIGRKGVTVDLEGEWERLTVRDAFVRYGGMSMEKALERDIFDEVMVERIEPYLGFDRPTFIHDYPAERSALARLKADDPSVAERFELYIAGIELANAFSELTDPKEQRRRFLDEREYRQDSGKRVYPLPESFLEELAQLPPSAGIALGVDRLVMLFTGAETIDQVVAFTPEEL
ncbi:MAG: EF-P lysine aminoacylase GenX [Geobacter sp.]|nr:EF-P lysine aminoacylase GenX [Geobacter sp.]